MYDMYRLLAIAKYDERYVIPPAHAEQAHSLEELATECSLDYEGGPGMGGSGPFGEGSGAPTPIAVENFQMLQDRQTSDTLAAPADKALAGQPAQLGRQGRAARAVPAADRGGRSSEPPRRRQSCPREQLLIAWQSASLLLDYPDEELLGRPRRWSGRPRTGCRPPVGEPAARGRRPPGVHAAAASSRPTTSRPSTPGAAATSS